MAKKEKTKLTGAELNCIEIAVQHHIDELEDALSDRLEKAEGCEKAVLRERLNATKSVKNKLWNLGGLIDDLEKSHYPVTAKQVAESTKSVENVSEAFNELFDK